MLHQVELLIERATIVQFPGLSDNVVLHVALPSPMSKVDDDEQLRISFQAERGKGPAYVKRHFGIDAEVLEGHLTVADERYKS